MAEIPLGNSRKAAFVDDIDLERVGRTGWHCNGSGYAVGSVSIEGRSVQVGMARFVIFGCRRFRGLVVHHKNGDKLDNRRQNLQVTTPKMHPLLHVGWAKHKRQSSSIEMVCASYLDLDACMRLSHTPEPFIITHGRGQVPFFVAFPVAVEGGEPGPGSAQLIHDHALDWGASCPDPNGPPD